MKFSVPSLISFKNWFLKVKNYPNSLFSKHFYLIFLENYRIWTKSVIQRYSIDINNFEMVINLALFTFAFSQMIWFRYKENSFSYFLKNAFPGVCLPCQTLSWETFLASFVENEDLKLEKVDIYPTSIVFSTESNRYFSQNLLDIGILPFPNQINCDSKSFTKALANDSLNWVSEKELNRIFNPLKNFSFIDKQVNKHQDSQLAEQQAKFPSNEIKLSNDIILKNPHMGVRWSSFFSYRLHSKISLFDDQFPSKLGSNLFSDIIFEDNDIEEVSLPLDNKVDETRVSLVKEINKKNGRNDIFLKLKKAYLFDNRKKLETSLRDKNFFVTFSQKNHKARIPEKKELFPEGKQFANKFTKEKRKIQFPKNFVSTQPISFHDSNKLFLKGYFFIPSGSVQEVKFIPKLQDKSTGEVLEGNFNQMVTPLKNERITKKTFFSNHILGYSHQFNVNPFYYLEKLFEDCTEKNVDIPDCLIPVFEEEYFSEMGFEDDTESNIDKISKSIQVPPILPEKEDFSQNSEIYDTLEEDFLNLFENISSPKPLFWLNQRLRSGFLYPDTHNSRSLLEQANYKENEIINFNQLKNKSLSINNFVDQQIFELPILPIEVIFPGHFFPSNLQKNFVSPSFEKRKEPFKRFDKTVAKSINKQTGDQIYGKRNETIKFGLKYKPVSLIFEKDLFYEGDGLIRNNFTLDVDFSNKAELNKLAKLYFSTSNLLTDRKEGFFGYSQKKDPKTTNKNKQEKLKEILVSIQSFETFTKLLIKDGTLPIPLSEKIQPLRLRENWENWSLNYYNNQFFKRLPVILCDESWQIPSMKAKEWKKIAREALSNNPQITIKKTIDENIDKNIDQPDEPDIESQFIELSIPLVRIVIPALVNPPFFSQISFNENTNTEPSHFGFLTAYENQTWPRTFIDYNLDLFEFIKQSFSKQLVNSKNVRYHSLPWSRSQFSRNLVSKRHFGDVYKRETTIFHSEGNQRNFNEHWEPFTTDSWMIVNQIGFVLFSFKVCQYCYKEYGKEVITFLLEALEALGVVDEDFKEVFEIEKPSSGFRILTSFNKRFKDVAGIDGILSDLSEIVLFLRNGGRSSKIGQVIPKGILFIGPPGTGKTFLASAIAGEAEVPILVQSGSTLIVPEQPGKGATSLKNLFFRARELAPSIIFIDEIDTLGEKRSHVTGNTMGYNGIVEIFANENKVFPLDSKIFQPNAKSTLDISNQFYQSQQDFVGKTPKDDSFVSSLNKEALQAESQTGKKDVEQLNLLTQFLIEMDGLESREGVIVIGATNRPTALDPAFIRPGRFDKIIQLEFPAKQKRIEILKLYSKNLGIEPAISWNYLADRTDGCSAADLSAAMNESSIQAILKDTIHTVETIEQGLDFIQNSTRQKPCFIRKNYYDPVFLQKIAFSQAGKAVLFTLLPQHSPCIFITLWEPLESTKNESRIKKSDSFATNFFTRFQLENILIGLYAGKVAEFLVLINNSESFLKVKASNLLGKLNIVSEKENNLFSLWESDLNKEDMRQATLLAQSMISKWYFYSKKVSLQKWNSIITNQNGEDLKENELQSFFKNLAVFTEMIPTAESSEKNRQKISLKAWWQNNVTQQTAFSNNFLGNWYRIYLADPEQSLRNDEFVPSDTYYHNENRSLNILKQGSIRLTQRLTFDKNHKISNSSIYWNDLYKTNHDYLYQALILNSFNKAFSILNKNREIIDFFADHLMRYQILRKDEILYYFRNFNSRL